MSASHNPPRRAESFSHCSIVLGDPQGFAGRLGWHTGVWERGAWRQSNLWTIEASLHFRMPAWAMYTFEGGWQLWGDGFRESPYVEYIAHGVYAKDRATAIASLVRDLKADPRAEYISYATVYRVVEPLTKQQVYELDQINARLIRDRAAEQDRLFGDLPQFEQRFGRRAAGHGPRPAEQRQLQFAVG